MSVSKTASKTPWIVSVDGKLAAVTTYQDVDHAELDAVGCMGGHGYTFTQYYFDPSTVSVEQLESGYFVRFSDN